MTKKEWRDFEFDYAASLILQDPLSPYVPCVLCGSYAELIGVWLPSAACARRMGFPKDKRRAVGYKICLLCVEESDAAERVETTLLRELEVQ